MLIQVMRVAGVNYHRKAKGFRKTALAGVPLDTPDARFILKAILYGYKVSVNLRDLVFHFFGSLLAF